MPRQIAIAVLRNDLRIHDNAALFNALKAGGDEVTHLLPVFVFDERQLELSGLPGYKREGPESRTRVCGFWRTGPHRLRFLAETVCDMRKSLQQRGSDLLVRFGRPGKVIPALIQALEQQGDTVTSVWMQKEVTAEETASENNIASALGSRFHLVHTKPLVHVEDLPFKIEKLPDVYTPFRKAVEGLREKMWRRELPMPDRFKPFPDVPDNGAYQLAGQELELDTLLNHLLKPLRDDPSAKCDEVLNTGRGDTTAYPLLGGETSALKRIDFYFFEGRKPPAATYKTTRNNMIGHEYSTKFSSALAVGSLSPRRIMTALEEHDRRFGSSKDSYWIQVASLFCSLFCSNGKAHLAQFELLWRDFFYYISAKYGNHLFYVTGFEGAYDSKSHKVNEWKDWNPSGKQDPKLQAWLDGRTGVPMVDANILELKNTGFMSNRGRQNVASFLTKDLYYDWRIGADFFESYLVDHDVTSNTGNWQYQAGVGTDPRASRQFNPIKQGHDYDAKGDYVALHIPALRNLSSEYRHSPWAAPEDARRKAGLLGGDGSDGGDEPYPARPIIEQGSWKSHYGRANKEGGGPPRGKPKGRGPGGGRGRGGRGRVGARSDGQS